MKKAIVILTVLIMAVGMVFASGAPEKAESAFPEKNIDWLVPVAAGAPVDLHVRALDNALDFGSTTSVTNMPGANQVLGITEGFSRPADGYTIVSSAYAGLVIQPATVETAYGINDFRHLVAMNEPSYNVILVSPNSKINSWEALKTKIKNGERILYTAANAGSVAQLAFLSIVEQLGGANIQFVSYNGAAEACTALMGNHVDIAIIDGPVAKNYVDNGTLKAIFCCSDQKNPLFPSVPCSADAGLSGLNSFAGFLWVCVKKDTPEDVVDYLKEKLYAAIESPAYQEFLKTQNESMSHVYKEEEITPVLVHAAESFKTLSEKYLSK